MPSNYDLIVIGAGPGGYIAAIRAAQLGLKVACVDENHALGGTCLRVGCIPSKALLESSEKYHEARNGFGDHGFSASDVELDLGKMLQRKDKVVKALTTGVKGLFKKNDITHHLGRGRLAGQGRVDVETADAKEELRAERIIIATGSRSAPLQGIELDRERIVTSTGALSFSEVPERLVVIGAGYIGLELGSVWSRLGSEVIVLEYLDRILPGMDAEIARDALKIFTKQGLRFELGARVTAARASGETCIVECEGKDPVQADRVLLAVGRKPISDDLGLDTIGVETDQRGYIQVDHDFKTAAPGVYAIGDVIGGAQLAHKAEEEGVACVEKMLTGYGHVNYDAIPGVVYTQPEIATVGKSEEQLKEAGVEYRKGVFPFRANGRARALGAMDGKVKVLVDDASDRLLGVHILGHHAGDLIAEATAALSFGASAEDVFRTSHAHPTLAEAFKEAALASAGRALNI